MLEEKISKRLGVPYIYVPSREIFLCENGVPFTQEEYRDIDINAEYERRKESDELYDYVYAKNTGILRKKRGLAKKSDITSDEDSSKNTHTENVQKTEEVKTLNKERNTVSKPIILLCIALTVTSFGAMWISTLHTATYLFDYFETVSAWIMSSIITLYTSTAFEVVILFKERKRYFLSLIFLIMWVMVVAFSMTTTVSVFYDKFNFNTLQMAEDNKEIESNKLILDVLKEDEEFLKEEIKFKKEDIEWRMSKEWATKDRTKELIDLQDKLQANREEQKKILTATPEVAKGTDLSKKRETFFDFLGRSFNVESGIIEFIMSVLSAVFINLIAPFTLSTVITLTNNKE